MLIAIEATVCPLDTPYSDLRAQMLIDFGNYLWVFDDELQRYHIARSMHSLVSTSTPNERRLLRIIRVGFRYCPCINKRLEEVALDSLLVMVPKTWSKLQMAPKLLRGHLQLHALVSCAGVAKHHCNLPFRFLFLCLNLLFGELCCIYW